MPKVLKLTCRLLWCLSACKKSFSSLTSFLTYCKDTTNLLFWELWKCLTIPIKIVVSISIMLTCMQKINFFIHYFLKILQRNSNGFILGNLGMHGHTHLKWQYHFEEPFHNHQQAQINFIFYVFLEILQRYCKLVVLGTLDMPGYAHPKWYYQSVEKFCVYLQAKISSSWLMPFWRYCKDMQTYFGYFGHAWLYTTKLIVSTCGRLQCLSACQKSSSSFTSSLRYYILKNPAIFLADSIWAHNWTPSVLPDMRWCWNINNNISFHFLMTKYFKK